MATAFIRKVHKREMTVSSPPRTVPVSGRSQCLASFAQQRIWRDEKSYFDPVVSPAVFNICMPLKIRYGSMSIVRIRSAIIRIVEHYKILRTAVYFNEENGQLEQEVKAITKDDNYSFEITHNVRSLEQINALLTAESITHFAQVHLGLVVRCHLIKMTPDDVEYLQVGDLIVFTFHQIAIDMSCAGLFIDAFHQAYDLTESWPTTSLQYIDFTLYEAAQSIDPAEDSKWNRARRFWSKSLDGYDWNKDGLLSVDFATGKRMCSGQGNSSVFTLDYSLVDAQIQFVSSNSVSMFQLGLACYFVFLSKLHVDGITDLCVASSVYNRPLVEMTSMIGNVVNLLPFRIKIDPEKSFMYLIGQIRILCREVLEHGYLPYQQIISIGNNGSSTARNHFHFHCDLDASLHPYRTKMETKTKDATLEFDCDRDWSSVNGTAVNDLTLTVNHNSGEHTTQCILTGSTDQYNSAIMSMMARRFQQLLTKLFSSNTTNSKYDRAFDPIASLLSEEARRIEGVTTHRSPNGTNEGMTSSLRCKRFLPNPSEHNQKWPDTQNTFVPSHLTARFESRSECLICP